MICVLNSASVSQTSEMAIRSCSTRERRGKQEAVGSDPQELTALPLSR